MRCLNCGNENPPDNIYCNECGARLQDMESSEMPIDAGAPVGAATGTGGSALSTDTQMHAGDYGGGSAAQTYSDHTSDAAHEHGTPVEHVTFAPAGAMSGDSGAAPVGEHYVEEHAGAMSGAASQPGGGDHDAGGSPVVSAAYDDFGSHGTAPTEMSGPIAGASSPSPSFVDDAEEIPLTEDTMAPTAAEATSDYGAHDQAVGTSMSSDTDASEMPGIIPIDEDEEAAPMVASYDEISPAASGTPATPDIQDAAAPSSGANREWATQALHQLDEAQQAMSRGDWVGFGQSLGNLRSFLEGIIQSSPAAVSGASGMAGAYQPQQQGIGAGGDGMSAPQSMSGGGAAGSATLEPAAEAGSLGVATAGGAGAASSTAASDTQSGYAPAVAQDTSPGVARLVIISTGAELPLPDQEEITVGREDPSSGIFPDVDLTPYGGEEGGVSRRHARLLRIGDDYYVEDLQSTNYTKLDGQRLPAHVRERLEDSARLDFGRVAVIFRRS